MQIQYIKAMPGWGSSSVRPLCGKSRVQRLEGEDVQCQKTSLRERRQPQGMGGAANCPLMKAGQILKAPQLEEMEAVALQLRGERLLPIRRYR